MEFTGERFIPGEGGAQIYYEHLNRYLLAQKLIRGKRVLDFGCGEGYGSNILSMKASSVIGLDISRETVENARVKYAKGNLNFIIGDCRSIPFKDNYFDVVISFEVIEHLEEQATMIEEANRILSHDGILIISSPNKKVFTEEGGALNKFHVKELYREEFVDLLEKYFSEVFLFGQDSVGGSIIWTEKRGSKKNSVENFQSNLMEDEKFEIQKDTLHEFEKPLFHIAVCGKIRVPPEIKDYSILFLSNESKRFLKEKKEKDEMIKKIEELSKIIDGKNREISDLQRFVDKVKKTLPYKLYKGLKTLGLGSYSISFLRLLAKAIIFLILLPFVALFWSGLVLAMIIFTRDFGLSGDVW
ncbi:MAG: hypothetical protein A2W05_01840 [Candidatus Schekmanbacteria bacterium RBG_16_38_10]|uniref:Methyltransferase type 11 domain-containing protein n=1 Tax=Candidatus Schekmanbacteria bacterium RBG_16_38_10 TaxID=1817879 RepID=A0A1F7RVR5_9BACT|nr:MAG: hypothetical protein A2W05_01840 [Candidatus Schekmanbacteria bacterium RBG_16_38_10]